MEKGEKSNISRIARRQFHLKNFRLKVGLANLENCAAEEVDQLLPLFSNFFAISLKCLPFARRKTGFSLLVDLF